MQDFFQLGLVIACTPFVLLWLPVSLAALWLYDRAKEILERV